MKVELKVGQTVYLKPQGNTARRLRTIEDILGKVIESKITKIGKKYFYVKSRFDTHPDMKIDKETMNEHSNYCSDWKAYLSKQDILDEFEIKSLLQKFSDIFRYGSSKQISLNQLRRIDAIISEDNASVA